MRLQNISMLIAAIALCGLATAALIQVFKPAEPTGTEVTVVAPEPKPEPALQIAPSEDIQVVQVDSRDDSDPKFAVLRKVENPHQKGEMRWTMTFYSLEDSGRNKADLHYLGSRCIEYDMGFDVINFEPKKQLKPEELRKYAEKAREAAKGD
ncbi:hypothetical protein OAU50_02980 [Planctomycetota bacterium]|nr:hypothetical protein [Planctomycetota bacterium]